MARKLRVSHLFWCLGSEEFRQELLAQVSQLASPRHAGEEIRESGLAKAQGIAQEELAALGRSVRDLQGRRKSDLRIAAPPRRETTMTLGWIAKQLHRLGNELAFILGRSPLVMPWRLG